MAGAAAVCRVPLISKQHMAASKYPFVLRFCKSQDESSSLYRLYSSVSKEWYFVDALAELDDAQILCSNYGWLLLDVLERLLFFHPSTGNIIDLPDIILNFNRMSFSAPPTSPGCVIFGLVDTYIGEATCYGRIAILGRGESSWTYQTFPNKKRLNFHRKHARIIRSGSSKKKWNGLKIKMNPCRFSSIPCKAFFKWSHSGSAPVFHNGAFYCLDQHGRLGVLKPSKKQPANRDNKWRLLNTEHSAFMKNTSNEGYLMKSCKGKLISIVVGPRGKSITVLKFNENRIVWERMPSLEDQVVFLSPAACITMSCEELGVTIHFVKYRGRHNVFYSLLTRKFHSLEGGYTSEDLFDTTIPLNCTWIPNFQHFSDRQLDWSLSNHEQIHESGGKPKEVIIEKGGVLEQGASSVEIGRPWIIMSHGRKGKEAITFVDMASGVDYSIQSNDIEERLRGKKVYGHGCGRVLLMNLEAGDCVLLDTKSMTLDALPQCEKRENFVYRCSLLYLPDESSKFMVMVFGVDEKRRDDDSAVVMFCGVGDKQWTIVEGGVRVMGVVACQGKIYAIGAPPTKRFRFLEIKLQPRYTEKVVDKVKVPRYGRRGSTDIRRYLVDFCGDLFFFYQSCAGCPYTNDNANVLMEMKVVRIDVKTMTLEEVENLGDKAFFLTWSELSIFGSGGFGCCASKSGFKRNTIYMVNPFDNNLYLYDYGDQSVSATLSSCPEVETCSIHEMVLCY